MILSVKKVKLARLLVKLYFQSFFYSCSEYFGKLSPRLDPSCGKSPFLRFLSETYPVELADPPAGTSSFFFFPLPPSPWSPLSSPSSSSSDFSPSSSPFSAFSFSSYSFLYVSS